MRVQITKDRNGEDGESGQVDVWSEDASLKYADGVWRCIGWSGELIFQDLDGDAVPKWATARPGGKRGWPVTVKVEFKRVQR